MRPIRGLVRDERQCHMERMLHALGLVENVATTGGNDRWSKSNVSPRIRLSEPKRPPPMRPKSPVDEPFCPSPSRSCLLVFSRCWWGMVSSPGNWWESSRPTCSLAPKPMVWRAHRASPRPTRSRQAVRTKNRLGRGPMLLRLCLALLGRLCRAICLPLCVQLGGLEPRTPRNEGFQVCWACFWSGTWSRQEIKLCRLAG